MNARLTLLGVLALATGCFTLPDESEVGRFACRVDADCLDGYRCDGGTCAAAAAGDTTPPSVPTNVTLNGTAQVISIGWTNPTTDFAGVWVVRKVGSLPAARLDGTRIYEGVGTSTSDNQIAAGTNYCYSVFAYDMARNYSAGAAAGCYTPTAATGPSPVPTFTARAGTRAATLEWTFPMTGYAGVAVRRAATTIPATITDGTEVYRGTASSFVDSSLTANTSYCYSAFVYDSLGTYSSAKTACVTPTAPQPVTNITLLASDGAMHVSWTNPTDPGFGGVTVRRTVSTGASSPTDGVEAYNGTGATFDDTGLTNGTTYCYSIYEYDLAHTYAGRVYTCATPKAVPPVTSLLTTPANGSMTITWTVPIGVTSVQLRVAPNAVPTLTTGTLLAESATLATFTHTGLTNGSLYCYAVFTLDAGGASSVPVSDCSRPREVNPLFPWARRWTEFAAADGTACTTPTSLGACKHGGELRQVALPASVVCAGLTATDALGAFDWSCIDGTPARVVSTGLKPGKGLIDLVDRATPAWRPNSVTWTNGTTTDTTASETWWANPVKAATAGDTLTTGTVYVLSPAAQTTVVPSYTAIIPAVGAGAFSGVTASSIDVISVAGTGAWVEGLTVQTTAAYVAVHVDGATLPTLRSLVINGGQSGVLLFNSTGARVNRVQITGANTGLLLSAVRLSTIDDVVASNGTTAGSGVMLTAGSNTNVLSNVRLFNGANDGLDLSGASANVITGVTVANNAGFGIRLAGSGTSSFSNVFLNVTSTNNGYGVSVEDGNGTSIVNLAAVNATGTSLTLSGSSNSTIVNAWLSSATLANTANNSFLGVLLAPSAAFCSFSGTNSYPGLDAGCTTTTATVTLGNSVSSSFKLQAASDTNQPAVVAQFTAISNWTRFDNPHRGWGLDLPTGSTTWPAATEVTNCTITNPSCRVWDWRLASSDTTLLNRVPSSPTYTHTWRNITTQADCLLVPGARWSGTSCGTLFVADGVELKGNGNGLCDENDTCVRSRNVGAYQGSGAYVPDGATGTLGQTYVKHVTNGEP